MEDCNTGDVIGMLLNLEEGTLTVYKNNRRLGVMKDGLSGLYCWYTSVWGGAAVTLKREEAPRASGVAQVEYENEEYSSEIKEEDDFGDEEDAQSGEEEDDSDSDYED